MRLLITKKVLLLFYQKACYMYYADTFKLNHFFKSYFFNSSTTYDS